MPYDFAATLPKPAATIGHQRRKRGSATLRSSSNSLRYRSMVAHRPVPVEELKIPVSGVQFSPCPPFLLCTFDGHLRSETARLIRAVS